MNYTITTDYLDSTPAIRGNYPQPGACLTLTDPWRNQCSAPAGHGPHGGSVDN